MTDVSELQSANDPIRPTVPICLTAVPIVTERRLVQPVFQRVGVALGVRVYVTLECLLFYGGYRIRDGDRSQAAAAHECLWSYASDRVTDDHGFELRAAIKRRWFNGGDIFWNTDRCEATATIECTFCDAGDGIRDADRSEPSAA